MALFFDVKTVFAEDDISMSFSSATISLDIAPGQFDSGYKDFSVSTTNSAGYTVTMSTVGPSSALTTTTVGNSSSIPTYTFPSGVDKMPASSAGYGYGYSIDDGAYYSPVPDPLIGDIRLFSESANGTYTYKLTFGVKPALDITADTYSNTFMITATINNAPACPPDHICYKGNGDDGTGTMPNQSASSNSSVMLTPPNFSRPGYGFAGWNTRADGTGTDYGAGETITTDDLSSLGLILYAKWIRSTTIMQNWTGCSSMSIGDVIALKDFRDDNSYAVAKLADGKCWMVENMRIDPSRAKISTANTNSPTNAFLEQAPSSASTNTMCTDDTAACVNIVSYNLNNMNRGLVPTPDVNTSAGSWYTYGGAYNWYTATAGNGTYDMASGSASGDICPAGWRLPTGNNGGDLQALNSAANSGNTRSDSKLRKYPLNFAYSGDYNGGTTTGRGFQGRFWSATANSIEKSYRGGYSSNTVTFINNTWNKWDGFSIRCIANNNNPSVTGNIHYEANGGTGSMPNTTNVDLYSTAAAANAFTHGDGLSFNGWNTKANGTGVAVADEDLVAEAAAAEQIGSGGTLTLYAMWGTFGHLTYDANGGSGAPNPVTKAGEDSWTFTVSGAILTKLDHTFLGWSTDPTATTADYAPGSTFTTTNPDNILYAVWKADECEAGQVCYQGNGADAGSSIKHSVSSGATIVLNSPNYSRNGYGFAGWNTAADGTGTDYGPNQSFTVGDVSQNGTVLYAKWIASAGNLQNWNGCSSMLVGDSTALTDVRDSNTYTVTKLQDNHCWMTENLRLIPSTANINTANTNSPTQDFIRGAPQSMSSTQMCKDNNSECIDKIVFDSNNLDRTLSASPNANNNISSWYSYGVLYNWYTATAGNGTYSVASGDASGDLCPAGWRLPTAGNNGEYKAMNAAVNGGSTSNSSGLMTFPANFIYSGDHNTNDDAGRGTYTRLWSSTASDANSTYRMGIQSNNVTPVRAWNKWTAFAVRCIAQT